MALTNRDQNLNAGQAPVTQGGSGKANDEILAKGSALIASMTDEQREALGSKSNTLHFQNLLGLQSKKADRVGKAREVIDSFKPVGVTLVSDIDIEVPVIDVLKDKNTGIDTATDIGSRSIKAGEPFDLTYYEFMFLIVRDEYSGFCDRDGDPHGVYFSPKMPAFWRGEAKLPTPTINFTKDGSPKEHMLSIDVQNAEGKWSIMPEYQDKFGALLRKAAPTRAAGTKKNTATPTVVAVALKNILGI